MAMVGRCVWAVVSGVGEVVDGAGGDVVGAVLLDFAVDGTVAGIELLRLDVTAEQLENLLSQYRFRPQDADAVRSLPSRLKGS